MYMIVTEYEYSTPNVFVRKNAKDAFKRYGQIILSAKSKGNRTKRVTLFINEHSEYGVPKELCSSGEIKRAH